MKKLTYFFLFILLFSPLGLSNTIYIPKDFPNIQQGIENAAAGDTIVVSPGTFYENIHINKSLFLFGSSVDSTIIYGSGEVNVVSIKSNNVQLKNLIIRNSGNIWCDAGVSLDSVNNCIVELCHFYGNNYGLKLSESSYNIISRCKFEFNNCGILLCEPFPIGGVKANFSNFILNNVIQNNSNSGIDFEHVGWYHHRNNIVKGNSIFNNKNGIYMIMSQENDICYNDICNNISAGIRMKMCMGGGQLNSFHHNNFLSNNDTSFQALNLGGGTNFWYSEEIQEGNYWSDYNGNDNNFDGIGDVPYIILADSCDDIYPLMTQLFATIKGRVTTENYDPLEKVYVKVVGTTLDGFTDNNGIYSFDCLGAGFYNILFSHYEYMDTTLISIPTTLAHTSELNIIMKLPTHVKKKSPGSLFPKELILFQNYPNPFNNVTSIGYSISKESRIALKIYDLTGRLIRVLVDKKKNPGKHKAVWNGKNDFGQQVSSGVYFCNLTANTKTKYDKIILIR